MQIVSGALRASIKRVIPARLKRLIKDVRDLATPPPIDDVVLAEYVLVPDASEAPRLNFVISNLTRATAFGGVTTGIDVFLELARHLSRKTPLDLRVIIAEPDRETDLSIMAERAGRFGHEGERIAFHAVRSSTEAIPVRRRDVFVSYSTWMTLNLQGLLARQAAHFGQAMKPLVFLIQEYEPHFYPFSSAHMLSREAYDRTERLWGVFNSSNLQWYFEQVGHSAERSFLLEPVINDKLRPYLDSVATSERRKRILVYGRPGIARNCFPAIVRGLRRWVRDFPEAAEWEVVSAGTAHKPIALGQGRMLESVGKLSLEEYAEMLVSSSVGLSLMASPHPSYPPLEMAHMGLRTITNGYFGKDLSTFHPNIRSVGSITEKALADALSRACAEHGAPVNAYRNESYVRSDPYPFVPALCAAIAEEIGIAR